MTLAVKSVSKHEYYTVTVSRDSRKRRIESITQSINASLVN